MRDGAGFIIIAMIFFYFVFSRGLKQAEKQRIKRMEYRKKRDAEIAEEAARIRAEIEAREREERAKYGEEGYKMMQLLKSKKIPYYIPPQNKTPKG